MYGLSESDRGIEGWESARQDVVPQLRRSEGAEDSMNCQHATWRNASTSGRPVVGISRCARCGAAATVADYRNWYVANQSLWPKPGGCPAPEANQ